MFAIVIIVVAICISERGVAAAVGAQADATTNTTTCLDWAQLTGVICGCIFGTILLAIAVAFILWRLMKDRRSGVYNIM